MGDGRAEGSSAIGTEGKLQFHSCLTSNPILNLLATINLFSISIIGHLKNISVIMQCVIFGN